MTRPTTLVVEPCELRAWRTRLNVSQNRVAVRAHVARPIVTGLERQIGGNVLTYKRVNEALCDIEYEQQRIAETLRSIEAERTQSQAGLIAS